MSKLPKKFLRKQVHFCAMMDTCPLLHLHQDDFKNTEKEKQQERVGGGTSSDRKMVPETADVGKGIPTKCTLSPPPT